MPRIHVNSQFIFFTFFYSQELTHIWECQKMQFVNNVNCEFCELKLKTVKKPNQMEDLISWTRKLSEMYQKELCNLKKSIRNIYATVGNLSEMHKEKPKILSEIGGNCGINHRADRFD